MKVFDQLESRRDWDENERLILDQVDRMVEEVIAPNAARIEKTGEFPWANIKAINDIGLNAIFVPEAGGQADSRGLCFNRNHLRHELSCHETGHSVRN